MWTANPIGTCAIKPQTVSQNTVSGRLNQSWNVIVFPKILTEERAFGVVSIPPRPPDRGNGAEIVPVSVVGMCTPRQQEILHKMDPYLDGLTLEQVNQLAVYDQKLANQEEFDRGWQAGCESGERSVRIIKVVVTIGLVLMVLAFLFSL
jgi:hypothetical protein